MGENVHRESVANVDKSVQRTRALYGVDRFVHIVRGRVLPMVRTQSVSIAVRCHRGYNRPL